MAELNVILLTLVVAVSSQLNEGDICRSHVGTYGECKELSKCDSAVVQIRSGATVKTCSFKQPGDVPVVCCTSGDRVGHLSEQSRRSKSYQKCVDYAKMFEDLYDVPVLTPTTVVSNHTDCTFQSDGSQLIAGGVEASAEEFPHMALLGFGPETNISWKCGGSLISERFVLTAAHCLFDRETRSRVTWARLGDLNIKSTLDDEHAETLEVVEWIQHPNRTGKSHYHDIALLRLEEDVTFTSYIRPACIHHVDGFTSPQLVALVSGWGKTNNEGGTSDVLMKADLKFKSYGICDKTYQILAKTSYLNRGIDRNTQICAGDPKGLQDTCQGDSGGPIQIILSEPPCMYDLVGITSFGPTNCGPGNSPAVYTRIQNYIPWIESKVWQD